MGSFFKTNPPQKVVFSCYLYLVLLEAPLGQCLCVRPQETVGADVSETEARGEGVDEVIGRLGGEVVKELDTPKVVFIAHLLVSVTTNLVVARGHGRWYRMAMEVGLGVVVTEDDDVSVLDIADWPLLRLARAFVGWQDVPVVVVVVVRVRSHLLLPTACRIRLHVRVEERAVKRIVAHSHHGAVRHQLGPLAELGLVQVGLEERGHVGIAGSRIDEDRKMRNKDEHVQRERHRNQAYGTCNKVLDKYRG